jgi:hypothetical protein
MSISTYVTKFTALHGPAGESDGANHAVRAPALRRGSPADVRPYGTGPESLPDFTENAKTRRSEGNAKKK